MNVGCWALRTVFFFRRFSYYKTTPIKNISHHGPTSPNLTQSSTSQVVIAPVDSSKFSVKNLAGDGFFFVAGRSKNQTLGEVGAPSFSEQLRGHDEIPTQTTHYSGEILETYHVLVGSCLNNVSNSEGS